MDREIELIKQEYEDKMKKKKSNEKKGKDKDKDKDKGKAHDDESKDIDDEKAEREKDAKVGRRIVNRSHLLTLTQDQSSHKKRPISTRG